ncbi:acyl transferase/acyl hydrolase/lysophospholipase [Lasiosphaeria hispida]|uniref:Acyl transferase/acyl hydrolase/lysophospholipase n=1 Tax=Lasiosphaeria hispida TaxID=260671 RepID=A0AAJ0MCQ1_9PEZI|nr:acyl transferase/acyl hydrolase/lysophospholipase [Lasiosphaeria hispida]
MRNCHGVLLSDTGSGLDAAAPLLPAVVFSKDIRELCGRAVSQFLDRHSRCAFVSPVNGHRCANTRLGHAQGHQDRMGELLQTGPFVSDNFDSQAFLRVIETAVHSSMQEINQSMAPSGRREWRRYASKVHQTNLAELRSRDGFPYRTSEGEMRNNFAKNATVCYGCFFGRPEYRLPCDHVICAECVEDFDGTPESDRYPGVFVHDSCAACTATGDAWPYRIRVKPSLAGVRVLSLDGGGVRGIVQLVVLKRLEEQTGLGIPLGRFFDLMVGTSAGGVIALGLGVQGRTVPDCIERFRTFARTGFKEKTFTKGKLGLGWLARMVRTSIYHTEPLEVAMHTAFRPAFNQPVFGLQNPCRVAVTTTVNKELKLIANYNRGGKGRYLNSDMAVSYAARCTSAAPMFFEQAYYMGQECWDGGLKANNPIRLAATEPQQIWGEGVRFDFVLSVGSGHGSKPQTQPTPCVRQPWLAELLKTLLSTMDGERAWSEFHPVSEPRIRDRAVRLNVEFKTPVEPSLDDAKSIPDMEFAAQNHGFYHHHHPSGPSRSPEIAPLMGSTPVQLLACLAIQLRASMFFFEIDYIEQRKGMVVFRGWICCRLSPGEGGFAELMGMAKRFTVAGQHYPLETPSVHAPFKLGVVVQETDENLDKHVRIDVDFDQPHQAAISGFPMTIKSLLDHGRMCPDRYVLSTAAQEATEQGGTP